MSLPDAPITLTDAPASAPAVVSIEAGSARGTGFFVRPDTVLTNNHVVEGQSFVQLTAGERRYSARVVTTSPGALGHLSLGRSVRL